MQSMFLITIYTNFCNIDININIILYYLNGHLLLVPKKTPLDPHPYRDEHNYLPMCVTGNMVGISVVFLVSIKSSETRCYMLISLLNWQIG